MVEQLSELLAILHTLPREEGRKPRHANVERISHMLDADPSEDIENEKGFNNQRLAHLIVL